MKDFFIIGHRGAAGEKFENSMSGFKLALSLDIDAIELDIHQQNGELWVIHDHELERLTGKPGLFSAVEKPSGIRLLNNEPVPKLKQVLDLFWGKMPINIEIKSFNTAALLLEVLSHYPALEPNPHFPWILISSFDHRQILELRQMNCPWPISPISSGVPIHVESMVEALKPYSWNMDDEYIDDDFICQMKRLDIPTIVFTVNNEARARELKQAGVAGVFTDLPSTMANFD
ncbi:MAG: glycerophosphoryl diester phosphodiesterase [Chitinophagales bacterium]|jgi:glycerophosphoryl diester phosphodiesterase